MATAAEQSIAAKVQQRPMLSPAGVRAILSEDADGTLEALHEYLIEHPDAVETLIERLRNRMLDSAGASDTEATRRLGTLEHALHLLEAGEDDALKRAEQFLNTDGVTDRVPNTTLPVQSADGATADIPTLFSIVKDLMDDTDIESVCLCALKNVIQLTRADRGSLFLLRSESAQPVLVSQLFDVTESATIETARVAESDKFRIAIGEGIVGTVAQRGQAEIIADAYSDARFANSIDAATGYRTRTIMSAPIWGADKRLIGVAQVVNRKKDDEACFDASDLAVLETFLVFAGLAILKAELHDMAAEESRCNERLLRMANAMFQNGANIAKMALATLTNFADYVPCDRVALYVLEIKAGDIQPIESADAAGKASADVDVFEHYHSFDSMRFHTACQVELPAEADAKLRNRSPETTSTDGGGRGAYVLDDAEAHWGLQAIIAKSALMSADQMLIDCSAEQLSRYLPPSYSREAERAHLCNVLAVPVFEPSVVVDSSESSIAVLVLVNRRHAPLFTRTDQRMLDILAVVLGTGLHNAATYERAEHLTAKQTVALEMLTYHATASEKQVQKLVATSLHAPDVYGLYDFAFVDDAWDDLSTCAMVITMFRDFDLHRIFCIADDVLARWALTIRKNYRNVRYHNWRHGLNVLQSMFAVLHCEAQFKRKTLFDDEMLLALLVAAACHDLDHRGTNNAFQSQSKTPLATLYGTSTMEHHHFDMTLIIVNTSGNNILSALDAPAYKRVIGYVKHAILSTDMTMYFKKKKIFQALVERPETERFQSADDVALVRAFLMTAADLSAVCKPWPTQLRTALAVYEEFFEQGDLEREMGDAVSADMFDRSKLQDLPKMQVGFLKFVCLPLFSAIAEAFPTLRPLEDAANDNLSRWQAEQDKVERGIPSEFMTLRHNQPV